MMSSLDLATALPLLRKSLMTTPVTCTFASRPLQRSSDCYSLVLSDTSSSKGEAIKAANHKAQSLSDEICYAHVPSSVPVTHNEKLPLIESVSVSNWPL